MAEEVQQETIDQEIRRKYGFMAWALDLPEIGDLLRRGATEDWDEATFRGELYKTEYWKTHNQAMREFDRLVNEDNAQAAHLITAKRDEMRKMASAMGLTLDPNTEFEMSVQALRFGWDETQTQNALANQLAFDGGGPTNVGAGSNLGAFMSRLNQFESDYMIHISQETKNDFIRRYARGEIDEAGVNNYFLTQAKSRRPYLSEQLDQGITVRNYFAPYIEQTAKLLEISPSEVDLLDNPKYAQMTEMAGADGKIRPMTLYEAGRYIRGLEDYKLTRQANETGASYSEAILRTFGEVA